MFSIERRGPVGARWVNQPWDKRDVKPPRRPRILPRRPVRTNTWPPDGTGSGNNKLHRGPTYVSFVSKAILWERGVCHHSVHHPAVHHPSVCPRFLSHMKVRPEDLHPPSFLTSAEQFPSQAKIKHIKPISAPKTQTLGDLHLGGGLKCEQDVTEGSRSAADAPHLQLPATPTPSSRSPTPLRLKTPPLDSEIHQNKTNIMRTTETLPLPSNVPPLRDGSGASEREKVLQPAVVEPDMDLSFGPSRSTPTSPSTGSLSDFSRPPSSLFSRSTDLCSGRSSVPSRYTTGETDSAAEKCVSSSTHQLSTKKQASLAALTPTYSHHEEPINTSTSTPSPTDQLCDQPTPCSVRQQTPAIQPGSDKPLSSRKSTRTTKNVDLNTSTEPSCNQTLSSDRSCATSAFPSTAWSSSTSPRAASCSALLATMTPAPPSSRLESRRWPVLPPISPVRGCSAASRCSEISCSQSHMFDELEAITPPSASCLSLDQLSDSSASDSPHTELSPGLAALTVGCDSGNLGSLSRVQLLLLDRPAAETLMSPSSYEMFSPVPEWTDLMASCNHPGVTSAGQSRPPTAGCVSERCDSAGNLRENISDWSDFGSPSSWIVDMFRFSESNHSVYAQHQDSTEEELGDLGRSNPVLFGEQESMRVKGIAKERDQRMEERKTKALNMLSKLQDGTPHQSKNSRSCSNFEDYDFLAKYCIFSQEKLAEYKRAFEAEDSDGDGYISSLQVLLALKSIIPAELLSEEEEIYVYRILGMVDFRVTDGLVDLRLFAVIASLAQKIASMDDFMRSLISNMDFRSLEVRLFKAKQLFLFLLEEQLEDSGGAQQGFISGEQLLLELRAGGIQLEQEVAIRLELQHIPPLDLLDFLAYLPLFMLIHKSVISNPLEDVNHL
nr:uncharacterized protein LOC107386787 isoform X1 [Nothobranchius furzeri]